MTSLHLFTIKYVDYNCLTILFITKYVVYNNNHDHNNTKKNKKKLITATTTTNGIVPMIF